MFTRDDLEQLENQGLNQTELENQLSCFIKGFSPLRLISAATSQHGVNVLTEEDIFRYTTVYENFLLSGLKSMKFVPASGAASRMFKNLFEFLDKAKNDESSIDQLIESDKNIHQFFSHLEKFAFYNTLKTKVKNPDIKSEWIHYLLSDEGLGYGNMPKGQIVFHKYSAEYRTAFEEHLIETISYCTGSDGKSKVHFTISPEHKEGFEKLLNNVKTVYQKRFGVQLDVSFSFQNKTTDTIAVDRNNQPIRDENGHLIFRPGGHGALIQNLAELDADIIFIKNIDNVVPDRLKSETKQYKKALAGFLVTIRNKIFDFIEKLDHATTSESEDLLNRIDLFLKKELNIAIENNFANTEEKISFLKSKLNRPIRICGMVKNEGEPGGGPFWVQSADGSESLQIVEKAQIDLNDENQALILSESTHFNPVDLICSIKDYKGIKFNLNNYIDNETGFISVKSKDGIEMKALEHPGLWNGAMKNWITIFIDVPISTFNPVKTVNDLLRPEHQ